MGKQANQSAAPARDPNPELYAVAVRHYNDGRWEEARSLLQTLLAAQPDHLPAWNALAVIAAQTNRSAEAESAFRKIIRAKPDFADAHHNLGSLLRNAGRLTEAEAAYRKVLEINPNHPDAYYNLGGLLTETGRPDEAEAAYRKALEINPNCLEAINGLGLLLNRSGRIEETEAAYRKALEINPNHAETHHNLGYLLKNAGRLDEAEAAYRKALQIKPDYPDALNNLANLLTRGNHFKEASACFERALTLNPDHPYAFGMAAKCRAMMCDWSSLTKTKERMSQGVREGKKCVAPFALLNFSDDPLEQRKCAEIWAQDKFSARKGSRSEIPRYRHRRIHLAYLSADFHNHATAHLMAELFERHDRNRFEVYGVSFGPDKADTWRTRLKNSFDQFLDVRGQTDEAVADQLRALEIGIAVDLKGYTKDCRTGIFALRPAPIQVNYLGYPGTMGAEFIDYLLADRFVVPEAHHPYYSEKVVYLPDSYQSNSRRRIADHAPDRKELGLPEEGFVFCCFNNTYKIHPPLFGLWMRLLRRVAGSVLWLFEANGFVEDNLRREAQGRGVDPDRLLFAPRLPEAEHLARQRRADLFLDTLPYNAHTTTSDALWAGLPVLTCMGNTFAARVAGSLLHAVGLPELVTDNLADYEDLALRLATHPEELTALKRKLEQQHLSHPLFDVDRFRRHIEAAYERMWDLWQRGESPKAFALDPVESMLARTLPGAASETRVDVAPETEASMELRIAYRACPICASDQWRAHGQYDCSTHSLYSESLPRILKWVECLGCGHIFTDSYYSRKGLEVLFKKAHAYQLAGGEMDAQRRLMAPVVERVLRSLPSAQEAFKGRYAWFEVGFGNGALVMTAAEFGFEVTGFDLREQACQGLRTLGYHAEQTDFLEIRNPPHPPHVISMMDVLEHMPFPVRALRHAHDLLHPRGVLCLSLPNRNCSSWRTMDWANTNPYWIELEHHHNFSRASLMAVLEQCGFVPVDYAINARYKAGMEILAKKAH